ncbi:unnamed protein product [Trichogramma brassicae]|uniref:Ionotropic glutamate receptor C-terminal domain-containing protein n=1 Tax=Trichogramma brassicae TaxID=86971 RepID=A0A6H5IGI3_9HYME|nr:unnamed protein product [Trichogramma brassicae]
MSGGVPRPAYHIGRRWWSRETRQYLVLGFHRQQLAGVLVLPKQCPAQGGRQRFHHEGGRLLPPHLLQLPVQLSSRLQGALAKHLVVDDLSITTMCTQIFDHYFRRLVNLIVETLSEMQSANQLQEPQTGQCNSRNASSPGNGTNVEFDKRLLSVSDDILHGACDILQRSDINLQKITKNDTFEYEEQRTMIAYKAEIEIKVLSQGQLVQNGTWNRESRIQPLANRTLQAARRYFRVGTAEAIPWTIKKRDPLSKLPMKNPDGSYVWDGYCIELIQTLANMMDFDYDLVVPDDGEFGQKVNGVWNGLVGDLAKGQTDIAVAALTMTSEREEVIDFVAPYFEQSGILIGESRSFCKKVRNRINACYGQFAVMRKPVRKASLFKFMTVLRLEVWLSIVGALTLTGIMIWLLDKYSPYSARNNKHMYPYPCREFTLKESFWFALTSFTPQGGGEAPKALSSRTLVAAYWLFVVLMLATFTANLAAFLTVERMQVREAPDASSTRFTCRPAVILDLQKDRYFEALSSKYWNQSLKSLCPNADDNEGITLESLGGVFIATLFGLSLAMITLAGEVIYYRRRNGANLDESAAAQQQQQQQQQQQKQITMKEAESSVSAMDQIMIQKLAAKLQLKAAPAPIAFGDEQIALFLILLCKLAAQASADYGDLHEIWHHIDVPYSAEASELISHYSGQAFPYADSEHVPYQAGKASFHSKYSTKPSSLASSFYEPSKFKKMAAKVNPVHCQEIAAKETNTGAATSDLHGAGQMSCYRCKDPQTGSIYENCSYNSNKPRNVRSNVENPPFDPLLTASSDNRESSSSSSDESRLPESFRFTEQDFDKEQPSAQQTEKCEKVLRDSMLCLICQDPRTNGKYEQCSYVANPNEKAYAYSKSSSFGGPGRSPRKQKSHRDPSKKAKKVKKLRNNSRYPSNPYDFSQIAETDEREHEAEAHPKAYRQREKEAEDHETSDEQPTRHSNDRETNYSPESYHYYPSSYEAADSRDDESEELPAPTHNVKSSSGGCKTVHRKGEVCQLCTDPKTGGQSENCQYAYEPKDKAYKYSKSKSFGYPTDDKKADGSSSASGEDYSYAGEPSTLDYIKTESERISKQVKGHGDCRKVRRDSMICTICKDAKTGGNYEQCNYAYEPDDKVYAYSKSKHFGNPTKSRQSDDRSGDDDDQVDDNGGGETSEEQPEATNGLPAVYPTGTSPLDYIPKASESKLSKAYVLKDPNHRDKTKSKNSTQAKEKDYDNEDDHVHDHDHEDESHYDTSAFIDSGYQDASQRRAEMEKIVKDIDGKDKSKCTKHERGPMTCYSCKDERGAVDEECVYVTDHAASTSSTLPPDVLVVPTDASTTMKTRVKRTAVKDDEDGDPPPAAKDKHEELEVLSEELDEAEPYDYVAETRPVYDKVLGITLPAYMLLKSPQEKEFDQAHEQEADSQSEEPVRSANSSVMSSMMTPSGAPMGLGDGFEPPAAIQNAMMTKDKKPFTYTPGIGGKLDLSMIRSPRMARRVAKNANDEGIDGPTQTISSPEPYGVPNYPQQQQSLNSYSNPSMSVPVFPQNIPQQQPQPMMNNASPRSPPDEAPVQPSVYVPASQQQVQEPKKYTGGAIPSRSFRLLQAMTAPENIGSQWSQESSVTPTSCATTTTEHSEQPFPPPSPMSSRSSKDDERSEENNSLCTAKMIDYDNSSALAESSDSSGESDSYMVYSTGINPVNLLKKNITKKIETKINIEDEKNNNFSLREKLHSERKNANQSIVGNQNKDDKIIKQTNDHEDEINKTVSVSLPLRLKFSVSDKNEDITTVIVGDSTIKTDEASSNITLNQSVIQAENEEVLMEKSASPTLNETSSAYDSDLTNEFDTKTTFGESVQKIEKDITRENLFHSDSGTSSDPNKIVSNANFSSEVDSSTVEKVESSKNSSTTSRKMNKYQRTQTHSRLFKLLNEELRSESSCSDHGEKQTEEKSSNDTVDKDMCTREQTVSRISRPKSLDCEALFRRYQEQHEDSYYQTWKSKNRNTRNLENTSNVHLTFPHHTNVFCPRTHNSLPRMKSPLRKAPTVISSPTPTSATSPSPITVMRNNRRC